MPPAITTGDFTPAMQAFLSTATARGLGEWVASHGALTSLRYGQSEPRGADRVLRYRVVIGDARLWFSFTLTASNKDRPDLLVVGASPV